MGASEGSSVPHTSTISKIAKYVPSIEIELNLITNKRHPRLEKPIESSQLLSISQQIEGLYNAKIKLSLKSLKTPIPYSNNGIHFKRYAKTLHNEARLNISPRCENLTRWVVQFNDAKILHNEARLNISPRCGNLPRRVVQFD